MALAAKDGTSDILGTNENGEPIPRYHAAEPLTGWTGAIPDMCLYAGQSCAVIHTIPPAATLWHQTHTHLHTTLTRIPPA